MFLKSLEIRGFKSFADKTDLNFKNGITAVVGPNGSGKSNITDAVRWVLGEQSVKSLRGGKMEDVIFAGTQFRKPVGLAQVSLTFDNSAYELPLEYNEVIISRRLYRSGDSEYYINNTQCRLRDILELFMDTGIGKEGYSIIGQGKIDAILSGKAEERRSLIEEAAGIVKYKSRKEEAEKKLNNTEQNLVRINDIISTYEERIEPLRIENEKANQFIGLSEKLKSKEIALILHSVNSIQDKLKDQRDDLNKILTEIDNLIKEKESLKQELNKSNEELELHEKRSSSERDAFYNYKNNQQSTKSEISLLRERVSNLKAFVEKAMSEQAEVQIKAEEMLIEKIKMEAEVQGYIKQQNENDKDISNYENFLKNITESIGVEEEKRNKLREEALELLRKISSTKNEVSIIGNNKESFQKKMEQADSLCENYMSSIKINVNTKLVLENEIQKINSEMQEQELDIKNIKSEINKLTATLTAEETNLKRLNVETNKCEANHSMLINLEKQYEGYTKSVKNLMQNIENGKVPEAMHKTYVLGEVIKVDAKLETAIEVAIGGAISDVITENESVAKTLINFLKSSNLGRATFLPLNILKYKQVTVAENIKNNEGYLGIASELISYDTKFLPAVRYILGRTMIAKDMETALIIAKQGNYSNKIVTLTGEVINPGGSMTGGSIYHKAVNIIGRKREIEGIKFKIDENKQSIEQITEKISRLKSDIKFNDDKSLNLKDDIHYKHIEITKIQGKISALLEETQKLNVNLKTSKEDMIEINKKLQAYEEEVLIKNGKVQELIAKEKNNELEIEKSEQLVKGKLEQAEDFKEKYTELKIKKAQHDEMLSNKLKELERISREVEIVSSRKLEIDKELTVSEDNINKNNKTIENLNLKIDEFENLIINLSEKFEQNEIIRIEVKNKIKNNEERLENISNDVLRKEEGKHKLDILCAKNESEYDLLIQKLNEEFMLTYAEAEVFKMDIESVDEFKSEINSYKNKISSLGTINLGAIEEYAEIKEKYTFMSEQKEDLIKAKQELVNVIDEMTNNMKMLFNENFKKLKENFNETFKELFKGGSADLILSDGDELNADIDINVQPPGKKLQNINLMSGGEKVMSAIALLFAILKMKPTPFCILDEIEAALDDANVFRYAEFLRKFSQNIQFIVITHRKGTMEASDVLYGVTMEEKGVSKIVSVDLSKV